MPGVSTLLALPLADEERPASELFAGFAQFFLAPVQGWRETGFHVTLQDPLGLPRLSRQITLRC